TREHLRASPARARTRRYQVPGHGGKDLGPPRPPAESRTTTTLRPSAGYRLISSVPLSWDSDPGFDPGFGRGEHEAFHFTGSDRVFQGGTAEQVGAFGIDHPYASLSPST